MTMLVARPLTEPSENAAVHKRSAGIVSGLEYVAVLIALVGFALDLWGSGGRDRGVTDVALLLTLPALIACRPWRRLTSAESILVAIVVAAVAAVPLMTTMGVSGLRDANAFVYSAAFYVAIRSFVNNQDRGRFVAVGLLVIAAAQFVPVWRVWLGEHTTGYMMVGTFYWHNQFGAFAGALGVYATTFAARSRRIDDVLGWAVAPLLLAFAYLSRSRGAVLGVAVAGAALLVILLARRHWGALVRLVGVGALAALVVLGFLAAVQSGSAHGAQRPASIQKDSLSSTGSFRLNAGKAALHVIADAPVISHGFGTFGVQGPRYVPDGQVVSKWVHSGEPQAFTDGGLIVGLPVLLVVVAAVRRWSGVGRESLSRNRELDWARLAAAAAGAVMLLHFSMDFDSEYPTLLALLAALVALSAPRRVVEASPRVVAPVLIVAAAASVLVTVMVSAFWRTEIAVDNAQEKAAADVHAGAQGATAAMRALTFTDPRPAALVVHLRDEGAMLDDSTVWAALAASRDYARLDDTFGPVWNRVAVAEGYGKR
jgi:hypothetical protein